MKIDAGKWKGGESEWNEMKWNKMKWNQHLFLIQMVATYNPL